METIKDLALQSRNLQESSLKKSEQATELSIYRGELTPQCLVESMATIKKGFPSLPGGFYDLLCDRVKENGFSDERLRAAVANVIDTCIYPTPTIAQFISFDRKIKLNTYEDMLKKMNEYGPEIWNSYKQVMLSGRIKPVWILIDEVNKYKLEMYEPK
jgi:hypothetical protein